MYQQLLVKTQSIDWQILIYWLLRIGVGLEFIGHGAWGILTKAAWVPYITFFGFSTLMAWKLMPLIGIIDVLLGLSVLLSPQRACLIYMVFWGFLTALLRPLTGESWWQFAERSYNFGVPFILLVLLGNQNPLFNLRHFFAPKKKISLDSIQFLIIPIKLMIVLYLIAHGVLAFLLISNHQIYQIDSLSLVNWGMNTKNILRAIGCFEIGLGFYLFFSSSIKLLILICFWKLGTEFLFIWTQSIGGTWEFIERFSSYIAPLVLLGLQCVYKPRKIQRCLD